MAQAGPPPLSLRGSNDAQVQGTNDDAQLSKMSCVKLGYFEDQFIRHFVKKPVKRAPLINRGYYSRFAALRGLLLRFLALTGASQLPPPHQQPAAAQQPSSLPQPPPLPPPPPQQQQQQQQQPAAAWPPPAPQQPEQQAEPQQGLQSAADGASVSSQQQQQQQQQQRVPARERQVLSLGAGHDTAFFQLVLEGRAPERYVEVDFGEVTARKAAVIQQTPELLACLGDPGSYTLDVERGRLVSPRYCLVPADLRDVATLESALAEVPGWDHALPTFVISECVLVYMEPQHSAEVVRWLGSRLRVAAMAIYEQIRPNDPFGQQMLHNLECRGCPLKGIYGTPDLEAQRRRFTEGGWHRAEARSMDDIYRRCINPADRRRVERLELFDEFEEWDLIQAHYCIALGIKDETGSLLEGFGFPQYAPAAPGLPAGLRRSIG